MKVHVTLVHTSEACSPSLCVSCGIYSVFSTENMNLHSQVLCDRGVWCAPSSKAQQSLPLHTEVIREFKKRPAEVSVVPEIQY